jgi:hypothetical protein
MLCVMDYLDDNCDGQRCNGGGNYQLIRTTVGGERVLHLHGVVASFAAFNSDLHLHSANFQQNTPT